MNGTALFLTKKHETKSKLSFDQKFRMQVISCIIKLNNRNHESKNEIQNNQGPKPYIFLI